MSVVWLLWEMQWLRGVYPSRRAATRDAATLHRRLAGDQWRSLAVGVRVEPWWVQPPGPSVLNPRGMVREAVEEIRAHWGLVPMGDLGSAHYPELEHYLTVPYQRVLQFPAFQFTPGREQWPGFREALGVFRDRGWDEATTAMWFVSRQAATEGMVPALLVREDPETVVTVARRVSSARR